MSLTLKAYRTCLPVPEGSHMARCYALIDLGMQYSQFYDVTLPKVMIGWELTQKLTKEGKPHIHFQCYTASLHEKALLRGLLESWRGEPFTAEELEGFELKNYLNQTCYLTIRQQLNSHTGFSWPKVMAISPLPPFMCCGKAINPPIYFDLDAYSESDYLAVPEHIRKHIPVTPPVKPLATHTWTYHPPDPDEPHPDVDL